MAIIYLTQPDGQPNNDAFEHLCSSLNWDERRLIFMFTAYFDESFSKEDDVYTVAGYLATCEQWKQFQQEWSKLCSDYGVSYIHKKDLESFQGEFRQYHCLPPEKHREIKIAINNRAADIILANVKIGFSANVAKSVFDAADEDLKIELGGNHYAICGYACLNLVAHWIEQNSIREPIEYIFEDGAFGRGKIMEVLRKIKKNRARRGYYRLNDYSFRDKKDQVDDGIIYPGLRQFDAADFFAWSIHRYMADFVVAGVKKGNDGNPLKPRPEFLRLLQRDKPEYDRLEEWQMPVPHNSMNLDAEKFEMITTSFRALMASRNDPDES